MSTFWELFKQSIVVQGLVTLVVVGAICYLAVVGREIPSDLLQLGSLIVGFWFGSKVQHTIDHVRARGVR